MFSEIPESLQSLQSPCGDLVHEQQKEKSWEVTNVEAGGSSDWQKKCFQKYLREAWDFAIISEPKLLCWFIQILLNTKPGPNHS